MPMAMSPSSSPAVPAASPAGAPWWVHSFGRLYATVYGHRDEAEATANAPAIVRLLGVSPHARILDLACGEGRYARALAALGHRVTGVDLSHDLLEEGRRKSPDLPGAPTYLRADMRELPFSMQFDAVVSLFTSFGYFDDRGDDARVLDGVARALIPGGRFLLDVMNAVEVRANLVPASETRQGDHVVRVRRSLDDREPGGPYVRKHVVVIDAKTGHEAGVFEERVRLYAPDELDAALETAGLSPVGPRYGAFDGRAFDDSAPRLVRVAARRGRARPPGL